MIISYVIKDFIDTIKERNLDFNFPLKEDLYDPDLDFDNRLRSYLVRVDDIETMSGDNDWIAICFNRTGISPAPIQPRDLGLIQKNIQQLYADTYDFRLGQITINIAFFCNSLTYIEDFEEMMYLRFNKIITNNVQLPILNTEDFINSTVTYSEISLSDPNKLSRDEKGSILELPMTVNAVFPIISNKGCQVPLIGEQLDSENNPTGYPKINRQIFFKLV